MIEEKDRLLLSHLQKGLPLVSQPFAALGTKISSDSADVLLRIEKLKKAGLLKGIQAFWDEKAFHYQSAWAAIRLDAKGFFAKAQRILDHPGVIYAAEMEGELNCWFFITVPAGHHLEAHVHILEKQTASEACAFLPLKKTLKGSSLLGSFEGIDCEVADEYVEKRKLAQSSALSLEKIRVIRTMQGGVPITDAPYQRMAEESRIPVDHFLSILNELLEEGYLKRIGACLEVKKSGKTAKTLVAWRIPEEKLKKTAESFLEIQEIVYAGTRPSYPAFAYSVYTLIEAKDPAELEVRVRRIEDKIGKWPHKTVPVLRRLKAEPMRYFPRELESWWAKHRSLADELLQNRA